MIHTLRKQLAALLGSYIDYDHDMRNTSVGQHILANQYRLLVQQEHGALPSFTKAGFQCFSQFEEDGILLLLTTLLPEGNRQCAESGCGNGRECMTANLIVNHGWWGFLFDGSATNVSAANKFFRAHRSTWLFPPKISQAFFTARNVNDLCRAAGVPTEIQVLSIDVDGMDYWIWDALDAVQPTIVVVETNNIMCANTKLVAPYAEDFVNDGTDFFGASLAAMTDLATTKGYRLVGTHRYGFNAFYVKRGVGEELFREVSVQSCLTDPYSKHAYEYRWPLVADRPWITLSESSVT